uniref:(California timema) hypothetical protein n=1 Tax=Timema californicum TaxID=61474 RepID=A0A7R9J4Q7_TIMCA|nr:unnamed protein product [Timema californicum]
MTFISCCGYWLDSITVLAHFGGGPEASHQIECTADDGELGLGECLLLESRVTAPTSQGILGVTAATTLYGWEQFGVELLLTFIVVLTYLVCMDSYRQWLGSSALLIGAAYLACTLVMVDRSARPQAMLLKDSSSIHSDEDPYDDLDKPAAPKFHGSTYNTLRATEVYRPTGNQGAPSTLTSTNGTLEKRPGNTYCQSLTSASLYSAPACKLDRVESLYGGTKSLYAKSPPLTRANLNRSQSVYSKVISGPAANHREGFPRSGPLVPSQSLYPMSFNQNTSTANQNVQNQQNQRSESIYGVRGIANSVNRSETGGVYDMNHGNAGDKSTNGAAKFNVRANRPESMYGMVSPRRQDSADVSYGSYHSASSSGTSPRVGVVGSGAAGNTNYSTIVKNNSGAQTINANRNDMRHSPQPPHHQLLSPVAVSTINTTKSVASYHHNKRYSPNIQY